MTAFYEATDVYTLVGMPYIYMEVKDVSDGGDFSEELVMTVDEAEELRDLLDGAIRLFDTRRGIDRD